MVTPPPPRYVRDLVVPTRPGILTDWSLRRVENLLQHADQVVEGERWVDGGVRVRHRPRFSVNQAAQDHAQLTCVQAGSLINHGARKQVSRAVEALQHQGQLIMDIAPCDVPGTMAITHIAKSTYFQLVPQD